MKLIVAEKPSVAGSISAALGIREKKDGYYEGLSIIVSWCVGHLVELAQAPDYNPKYEKWRWEDLPKEAQDYVNLIQNAVGAPITYISVGPERDSYIHREG